MKFKFSKKTIFDSIEDNKFNDAAIARRMKEWIKKGSPELVERAIRLYKKQTPEKREELAKYGLTEKYIKKQIEIRNKRK